MYDNQTDIRRQSSLLSVSSRALSCRGEGNVGLFFLEAGGHSCCLFFRCVSAVTFASGLHWLVAELLAYSFCVSFKWLWSRLQSPSWQIFLCVCWTCRKSRDASPFEHAVSVRSVRDHRIGRRTVTLRCSKAIFFEPVFLLCLLLFSFSLAVSELEPFRLCLRFIPHPQLLTLSLCCIY